MLEWLISGRQPQAIDNKQMILLAVPGGYSIPFPQETIMPGTVYSFKKWRDVPTIHLLFEVGLVGCTRLLESSEQGLNQWLLLSAEKDKKERSFVFGCDNH